MKITFEGVTRVLDLGANISLQQSVAIQEFTGLPVFAWLERVSGIGVGELTPDDVRDVTPDNPAAVVRVMKKTPMFTDLKWIDHMAAAHWLMLSQAGEDAPDLDAAYPVDVLGFALAFLTASGEEMQAQAAQAQAAPKASPPARRAPSSKRTSTPKRPAARQEDARDLPSTGS